MWPQRVETAAIVKAIRNQHLEDTELCPYAGKVSKLQGEETNMSKLMTIELRGPSGCGKTTTAHELMTLLVKKGYAVELHDGEVMYRGTPSTPLAPPLDVAVLITVKQ
jgi:ABC-type dipeptide/oligopeptide/nickel transport system ATPase component